MQNQHTERMAVCEAALALVAGRTRVRQPSTAVPVPEHLLGAIRVEIIERRGRHPLALIGVDAVVLDFRQRLATLGADHPYRQLLLTLVSMGLDFLLGD
jgi:hypothetical protein